MKNIKLKELKGKRIFSVGTKIMNQVITFFVAAIIFAIITTSLPQYKKVEVSQETYTLVDKKLKEKQEEYNSLKAEKDKTLNELSNEKAKIEKENEDINNEIISLTNEINEISKDKGAQ